MHIQQSKEWFEAYISSNQSCLSNREIFPPTSAAGSDATCDAFTTLDKWLPATKGCEQKNDRVGIKNCHHAATYVNVEYWKRLVFLGLGCGHIFCDGLGF